jgi:ribosome recycling factor
VEGNIIRLPIPSLNEERRRELVKHCKKIAEDSRIAIRNIRREQIEELRKAEKEKKISEDDKLIGEERIQKVTDEFIKKVDDLFAQKEKEIMEE